MPKIFQYGSNMSARRLLDRIGKAKDCGLAELKDYRVVFDIFSRTNDCAAADMVSSPAYKAVGRVWEISEEQLNDLDNIEGVNSGNYQRTLVNVPGHGEVVTYVGTHSARRKFSQEHEGALPSNKYMEYIMSGLHEIRAPLAYRSEMINEGRPSPSTNFVVVERTYDNSSGMRISSAGICRNLRNILHAEVGDFAIIEYYGRDIDLQIRKVPEELVTRGSPCFTMNPATLSSAARKHLELPKIGERDTRGHGYKSMFDGVKIVGLEK